MIVSRGAAAGAAAQRLFLAGPEPVGEAMNGRKLAVLQGVFLLTTRDRMPAA
jgi:hypothetical protein